MRTTEADVQAIIDTKLNVEEIMPFLATANRLVTARLTGKYDSGILSDIEKYLTAHLISVRDFRVKSRTVGDAQVTYFATSTVGERLASTPHGQVVMQLDYNGFLSADSSVADIDVEAFG